MGKNKKKQKKQNKGTSANSSDLQALVDRLRQENEILRARLEKIAELAQELLPSDDEDDEYDELSRDVDDQIRDDAARGTGVDASV